MQLNKHAVHITRQQLQTMLQHVGKTTVLNNTCINKCAAIQWIQVLFRYGSLSNMFKVIVEYTSAYS